jgi:hypothetical protein
MTRPVVYVSVNGNDNNTGTDATTDAVATLRRAFEIVPEGGIIHLCPGVYENEFTWTPPDGVVVEGEEL